MQRTFRTIAWLNLILVLLLGLQTNAASPPSQPSSPPSSALQPYQATVILQAAWGTDIRRFGLVKDPQGERVGPRAFCLDRSGRLYIFDTVKDHIKHFDTAGKFLGTIGQQVPGYGLAADRNGLLVLDGEKVFSLTLDGRLIESIPISPDIGLAEGYGQWMRLDEAGRLHVRKRGKSYPLGKVVEDRLTPFPFSYQLEHVRSGFPNSAGDRWFVIEAVGKRKAVIRITDEGNSVLKEVTMETPDTFGVKLFLDQDEKRHFYIQTRRIAEDDTTHLEVRKYREDGGLVSIVECPNKYYTTVYKKLEIDRQGNIFQLMTTPEGVQIIKWKAKGE